MDEFFFSMPIGTEKSLCIGPITRREALLLADSPLGDGTGLYLFVAKEGCGAEIDVIAKIESYETAAMFASLLRSGRSLPSFA